LLPFQIVMGQVVMAVAALLDARAALVECRL